MRLFLKCFIAGHSVKKNEAFEVAILVENQELLSYVDQYGWNFVDIDESGELDRLVSFIDEGSGGRVRQLIHLLVNLLLFAIHVDHDELLRASHFKWTISVVLGMIQPL